MPSAQEHSPLSGWLLTHSCFGSLGPPAAPSALVVGGGGTRMFVSRREWAVGWGSGGQGGAGGGQRWGRALS